MTPSCLHLALVDAVSDYLVQTNRFKIASRPRRQVDCGCMCDDAITHSHGEAASMDKGMQRRHVCVCMIMSYLVLVKENDMARWIEVGVEIVNYTTSQGNKTLSSTPCLNSEARCMSLCVSRPMTGIRWRCSNNASDDLYNGAFGAFQQPCCGQRTCYV